MKNKIFGIYAKVFSYTVLILVAVIVVAALFFSSQISEIMQVMERQQLTNIFTPLFEGIENKSDDEVRLFAEEFHQRNASVEFSIVAENGEVIFQTRNAAALNIGSVGGEQQSVFFGVRPIDDNFQSNEPLSNGMTVYMASTLYDGVAHNEFVQRTVIVLLILLAIGALSASVFAHRIARPIRNIARDTKRMASLELVPPPIPRRDEIGQLAEDVYIMYEALKNEIERVREMEENQRYFFSAASHELKTPIASTLILLQGMLDNIGDYSNHPKYLLECIKKMKTQSKLISEILDIVRLTDGTIIPNYEKIDVGAVVTSVVASHQTLIEAKEQRLTINLSDTLSCKADTLMLTRVLSNVILNAVQNTPEHGEICIWCEKQNDSSVRLFILNKGANIDESALSNVFEPFYREDKARSSEVNRSGLGLTIVKKTLDCMGVGFLLENTDDGVCFWIDLPTEK
ncbi:MAG: HAMP domain-containing histidine kinase [Bacteroidales bacterium]|jgi:two-component system sensor histidine kinase VanS|nr:HAMP domain-containing histidine kinase [Bacteroidales bacterium]